MSITWNGISSDTIGVIVERIPNRYVPTRRFSPQQVAGRNGNILLVDKAFPNVEQEYEVYLSAEAQGLPSVARACAEWLMGPDGYCRLTDSYDTTVYREAFLLGGFDIENILNKFGRCTITFSCKPQKYLLTGDTPIEIPAGTTTTYTGDVVQFDVITGASITSLSTAITPIQDLHGYANPWPGGGGVNLFDPDNLDTVTVNGADRWGHQYTNPGTYAIKAYAAGSSACLYARVQNADSTWQSIKYIVGGNTATPAIVTITAGQTLFVYNAFANTEDVSSGLFNERKLQVALSSTQPDQYYPYENICPISGLTGLSVYRTRKNLIDPSKKVKTSKSIAKWYNDGVGFRLRGGQAYTLSNSLGGGTVYFYNIDGSALTYGSASKTYTPANDVYVYFQFYSATESEVDNVQFQLELGSTATAYEPYNGNTYSVDWSTQAGTVYGGTVDVVTGVLTVDMANIASYNGETINEPWLSSMDEYAPGATPTTGAQVVYELSTPLTYQLTPQEVEALVGTNNVWSSSGDVSVTVTTPFGGTVTNPTPFEARPLLEVSGVGEITINGKSIQILESVSDFEIDCETMEAEDNSKIYCMDFPELSGGENEIVGGGSITALTVTPRWWTL